MVTPMFTAPQYGGCARCHDAAIPLDAPRIREENGPSENTVLPAGSVIFLPGFYQ
jgi:hypothetical protein